MPPLKLLLTVVVLAGAIGGVVVWAYRPRPIGVEVGDVAQGLFVVAVEEDGRTRVRNRYVVSAPLAGQIKRPEVRAGDAVAAGSTLAALLPSPPPLLEPRTRRALEERVGAAEASLQEAVSRLERADAQAQQARIEVERVRALRLTGASTTQQLEREELGLRLAERDREAAERRRHASEHDLEQSRTLLRRYDEPDPEERWYIKSPVDGRVLRVMQESEASVTAGTPLMEIGDPHDLEVIADLLTADAVTIRPGAPVAIERWGGQGALAGFVRLVEPSAFTKLSALGVEEQRVWVVMDIASPHEEWATLGDGFRVEIRITAEELPGSLIVPASALFRRGAGWSAFVAREGVAHEVPVGVLRRSGRFAAVSSGLLPGDRVVLFPPGILSDGARIRIREGR